MRISELSATSGVPLPTVKYYLREGLLPAGERTARNQAEYGPEHLARLRLIRALIEVGRLSVADARAVLAASDDPELPLNDVLGAAHDAVTRRGRAEPRRARVERCARIVRGHGETARLAYRGALPGAGPGRGRGRRRARGGHAGALSADRRLLRRGRAAGAPGGRGRALDGVPDQIVRGVVIGTILGESLFNALRLLAQQSISTRLLEPGKASGLTGA